MNQLIIGDFHFGIKTNSVSWLESQLALFQNQIFSIIDNEEIDRIVFLGDLFDIRYSVQQQVGIEVKNIIRELAKRFGKEIVFLAGNHDYLSPLEEFAHYNSYECIFGEEFSKCYPNVKFVTETPYLAEDGSLFLPWYYTDNPMHFDEILYNYDFNFEVKCVFCHADLSVWPGGRIASLKGKPVYSGHIHFIFEPEYGNLHNIGAVLPLTFNDVNQDRYLYIIDDSFSIIKKIKNVTTPSFRRIYNDAIFNVDERMFDNTYMQLCINAKNMHQANYVEQIKYLKTTYINANIRVHVLDDEDISQVEYNGEGFNTNMKDYIENNVPKHLNTKYEYIKGKLNTTEA